MDWLSILGWSKRQIDDLRFIGYRYAKEGHYETAITFFRALIAVDPSSVYDLQTLGALYLQLGRNAEAMKYLDRSLQLNPNHYPTLLNRAKALLSLGYKQQGIRQAEQIIRCKDKTIAGQAQALIMAYGAAAR